MSEILDDQYQLEGSDDEILEMVKWWEKRRLWFNVAVGLSGLPGLFLGNNATETSSLIFLALIYGVIANLFYCLGWGGEILLKAYIPNPPDISSFRPFLFWIGLIGSILVTLFIVGVMAFATGFSVMD